MGLDELAPFDPKKRIIEYMLEDDSKTPLVNMTLTAFADETASESMAPGGGSIAAYVGALGVSLGTMVANLSSHKKGWDERWAEFGTWAEKGQELKTALLKMVDEDTNSFNAIIDAMRLPKATEEEKTARSLAIENATKYAVEVPLKVMQLSLQTFEIIEAMAKIGNPNSVTDAGVGALCARAAVLGAYLNVKVNLGGLKDESFVKESLEKAEIIVNKANELEKTVMEIVLSKLA
jgi:glutamate formiminotransferase/formiminotetrahydrofolate cyclodeaminase